ncbi:hypothetical protein [Nocardia terpenica]|uniref:Uncharacterized protein n=1 Tax=Nocardia terpenica TaxID=455432 RepID=A0A291RZ07_9NOCA|nr:hypothetical protein [Nocardia terpenica]ATL72494.1 hypothetical protein CRH09_39670 [Nocardia terpenica]
MTTTRTAHKLAADLRAAVAELREAAVEGLAGTDEHEAALALAELAELAAEALRGPAVVHLVGIEAIERDSNDLDSSDTPQEVKAAFADPADAQHWADRHNATVPWTTETKTVVLGQIPYIPAGAPGPDPAAAA